jgi:iron-sulfur cluster assembly protein
MSYVMDFEAPEKLTSEDYVMEYEGGAFKLACDPKSLLYLFGMKLDYRWVRGGGGRCVARCVVCGVGWGG